MLGNKKGFTGIELAVVLCAIGLVGYLTLGPAGKAISSAFHGAGNQAKQTKEVSDQYQMFYKDSKGNLVPAPIPYKHTEKLMNMTNAEPQESIWQKFGKLIIAVGALCLIFPAFGVWLFNRFQQMKTNFNQLVTGIEEAKKTMAPEAVSTLETSLSKKMDTAAKKAVKTVKVKL